MKTTTLQQPMLIQDQRWSYSSTDILVFILFWSLVFFGFLGAAIQFFDPAAGVLDLGILTVFFFGLLVGLTLILCSLWLQELLWQPFKTYRQNFNTHYQQLSPWQQSLLYFSSFFLLLYALISTAAIVF